MSATPVSKTDETSHVLGVSGLVPNSISSTSCLLNCSPFLLRFSNPFSLFSANENILYSILRE